MSEEQKNNCDIDSLKDLLWDEEHKMESLKKLQVCAIQKCTNDIEWYQERVKRKKRLGFTARLFAIIFVSLSGLIPVASSLAKEYNWFNLSAVWATAALVLAAFLIALDKFGGYTSGWIRYIQTELMLTSFRDDFVFGWQSLMIELTEKNNSNELVKKAIKECGDFVHKVNETVINETNAWAEAFLKVLMDHEKSIKDKTETGTES